MSRSTRWRPAGSTALRPVLGRAQPPQRAVIVSVVLAMIATATVLVGPNLALAQIGPTANDDSASVAPGDTVVVDVLANDSGDGRGDVLTISAITRPPDSGSASITDGGTTITFRSPIDFTGTQFEYQITNTAGLTGRAVVTIGVDSTTCGDFSLTPTDGGAAIDAAIVLANRCVGPQTIRLERGEYFVPTGFTAIEDVLTITSTDPAAPATIISPQVGGPTTLFRVATGAVAELRSLIVVDQGATTTFVWAQNATVTLDDVELNGDPSPVDGTDVAAVFGDASDITVRNSTITNADGDGIAARNGSTLTLESTSIVDPFSSGIEATVPMTIANVTISGAADSGIKSTAGFTLRDSRLWGNNGAAISVTTTELVDVVKTVIGIDPDANPSPNDRGIVGTFALAVTDSTIAHSKGNGIESTGSSTLVLTRATIEGNDTGLALTSTPWSAIDTTVASTTTDCTLVSSPIDNQGGNTDSDQTCFPTPNTDPVAVDDTAAAAPGESILIDVLANDTDPDGDPLTVTGTGSAGARVTVDGLSVAYTAPTPFSGETFTYDISDSRGGTASGSVTVDLVCGDIDISPADGAGSLQTAIAAANACPGPQTINVQPGTYVITATNQVTDELDIVGTDADNRPTVAFLLPTSGSSAHPWYVVGSAARFSARNLNIVNGTSLTSAGYMENVEATYDNVHILGGKAGCGISRPNTLTGRGGSLLMENSTIIDGNCRGIQAFDGAAVTIVNTEIATTAGIGIQTEGDTTIIASTVHGNAGAGIDNRNGLLTIQGTEVYGNTGSGIYATGSALVTDSYIGLYRDATGLQPAGNGNFGIDTTFADLEVTNTVIAYNGQGLYTSGQVAWSTDITGSQIRDNVSHGLVTGPYNSTVTVTTTAFADNGGQNCSFSLGTVPIDGGGNTDDDGTCGLLQIPTELVVNTIDDTGDADPGDGICNTGAVISTGEPACSLRAAVQEANAVADHQTIVIPSGTYDLATELDIASDTTLLGSGEATTLINGWVTATAPSAMLRLESLTLTAPYDVRVGARPEMTVDTLELVAAHLENALVTAGRTTDLQRASTYRVLLTVLGGSTIVASTLSLSEIHGFDATAPIQVSDSVLDEGTSLRLFGPDSVSDSSVAFLFAGLDANVTVVDSSIGTIETLGSAVVNATGGEVRTVSPSRTSRVIVSDMVTDRLSIQPSGDGSVELNRVTVTVGTNLWLTGGAVLVTDSVLRMANIRDGSPGTIAVFTRSTIELWAQSYSRDASIRFENSTVVEHPIGAALNTESTASVTIESSTFDVPVVAHAAAVAATDSWIRSCTFEDGGILTTDTVADSDGSCVTGSLAGVDPDFGPLQDNGGPTETLLPGPTSPLIDAGSATCPATDQRGEPRPFDGDADGTARCDVGAVEVQTATPPPATNPVQILDQPEGSGTRVIAFIGDDGTGTSASVAAVGGSAVEGNDFANLTVTAVAGGWQVSADLLAGSGDGDVTIDFEVAIITPAGPVVVAGTVTIVDTDAGDTTPPPAPTYEDICAGRSALITSASEAAGGLILDGLDAVSSIPFLSGVIGDEFLVRLPAPPVNGGCDEFLGDALTILHQALALTPPVARDDIAAVVTGVEGTVDLLANDGHVERRPLTVTPSTAISGGLTVEITATGRAVISGTATGPVTVPYEVCAVDDADACSTAQLTVVSGATAPPPTVRADWVSVNGGQSRIADVTANDTTVTTGTGALTPTSVTSAPGISAAPAGSGVTVQVDSGVTVPAETALTQTVCDTSGECATTTLHVLVNPDDAPTARRDLLSLPATGSAAIDPGVNDVDANGEPFDGFAGNLVVPDAYSNDVTTTTAGTTVTVTARPGFRGQASVLYETCDGGACSWGVIEVVAQPNVAPIAADDTFTVSTRDLFFGPSDPAATGALRLDVVGPAGGGADAIHGGAPQITIVSGGNVTNADGDVVATITSSPASAAGESSNTLWLSASEAALAVPKDQAQGQVEYQVCVGGTDLCDTATATVALTAAPLDPLDQAGAIPLWRVDGSGTDLEARRPLFDAFDANASVDDQTNAYLLSVLSEYVYEELPGDTTGPFADRFEAAFAGSGVHGATFYESSGKGADLITDAQVLVAETDTAILVIARGSESKLDWINNLTFPPENYIHAGFKSQADAVSAAVLANVASRPASKPIWVAGHSLGGAVAQILASRIDRVPAGVVTFGSPSPFQTPPSGDPNYTAPQVPPTVRYVNGNDPVPSLLQELGYTHVGDEYWITGEVPCNSVDTTGRESGVHLNFLDHSMSRYMPRMLRLLDPSVQEDMLGRYVPFAWQKWDDESGSVCDASMTVSRDDVIGSWQWGIAPQATDLPAADGFAAGAWIVDLDDRLLEVPAGVDVDTARAALEASIDWTVTAGRGDVIFDSTAAVDDAQWLYRPIAATGQPWEPRPDTGDTVSLTFSGCNPWTGICGTGSITYAFVFAGASATDFALATDDTTVDVIANDPMPAVGELPAGATITRTVTAIEGELLANGQAVEFIGGSATPTASGIAIDFDGGFRPPIVVLDHTVCANVVLPATSVRGEFEVCTDDALWLYETELPDLAAQVPIDIGPCDSILGATALAPPTEVAIAATTPIGPLYAAGSEAGLPAPVATGLDAIGLGVDYRWAARGELLTGLQVQSSDVYLSPCSGLGVTLAGDADFSIDPLAIFDRVDGYASGRGWIAVSPASELPVAPPATPTIVDLTVDWASTSVVGANTTLGPLELDIDSLLIQDGATVHSETVINGRVTLPGLGDGSGATALELVGTIADGVITLNGQGVLDGRNFWLDGFRLTDMDAEFTVNPASDSVTGTLNANVVVDVLGATVPITFTYDNGAWSLSSTWSAPTLTIGTSPVLLDIVDPAIEIGVAGTVGDATTELSLTFTASQAELLPSGGGPVAVATGIEGRVTGSGFATVAIDSIDGTFNGFGLVIDETFVNYSTDDPTGLVASFGRVAGQISGTDAASVAGVKIFGDGTIQIEGACVNPDTIAEYFSVGSLPVRVIEACVLSGSLVPAGVAADDLYLTVTGEFVLDDLAALSPSITIGDPDAGAATDDLSPNTFEFSATVSPDGTVRPWNLGPINIGFGPTAALAGGVSGSGSMSFAGYSAGALDGTLSGTGTIAVDLPGVGAGAATATITGAVTETGRVGGIDGYDLAASVAVNGSFTSTANTGVLLVLDTFAADLDILVSTRIDMADADVTADDVATDVTIDVLGVGGTGRLEIDAAGVSLGAANLGIAYAGGTWTFGLVDGSTTSGAGWFSLSEMSGALTLDTTGPDITASGGFSAMAGVDIGGTTAAALAPIVGTFSFDGSVARIDFSGTGSAPAFDIDGVLSSTAVPYSVSGGIGFVAGQPTDPDLAVSFGPFDATLFPGREAEGFSATASGVTGIATGDGLTLTAESVSGSFAGSELEVTGPVVLTVGPDEPNLLTAPEATLIERNGPSTTETTIYNLAIARDGTPSFDGLCATSSTGLIGSRFGLAGVLPVELTDVCVLTGSQIPADAQALLPDDALFAEVSGVLDLTALAAFNPTVRIGDVVPEGPLNSFTDVAAVRYADGTWQLWQASPVVLGIGPADISGIEIAADLELGGYSDGQFNGSLDGSGSASTALPGVTADLALTVSSTIDGTGQIPSFAGVLNVSAAGSIGNDAASGVVTLNSLTAAAGFALTATVDADGTVTPSLEVTLGSVAGAGSLQFGDDSGGSIVAATVEVGYDPATAFWTFTATGDGAAADLGWFAAGGFAGAMTIDASVPANPVVAGSFAGFGTVDFDGPTGSGAVNIGIDAGFGLQGGVITADFTATNPQPLTFTLGDALHVVNGVVTLEGGASYDLATSSVGDFDLAVSLDAQSAGLLPSFGGTGTTTVDATALGIAATLDDNGFVAIVDSVVGHFGADLSPIGAVDVVTGAGALRLGGTEDRYVLFETTSATVTTTDVDDLGVTTTTTIQVAGLTLFSDGTLHIGDVCVSNAAGLGTSSFGLAGVAPVTITSVCVLTENVPTGVPAGATFAHVTGAVNLASLTGLDASLTIGDAESAHIISDGGPITMSVVVVGDEVTPWDLGPIALEVGSATISGVTVDGSIRLGGYVDGVFIPDIEGDLAAEIELPGTASGRFAVALADGQIDVSPSGGSLRGTLVVDGAAEAIAPVESTPGAFDLLAVGSLAAELDLAITATRTTPTDGPAAWATTVGLELLTASGEAALTIDDGSGFFEVGASFEYLAPLWQVTAAGTAVPTDLGWLDFAEVSGTITVDSDPAATSPISGTLSAAASVDLDGPGGEDSIPIAALVDFTTVTSELTIDFTSTVASDVVDLGIVSFVDVSVQLDATAVVDLSGPTLESFDASAIITAQTATLFGGEVTATGIVGRVDRSGLELGVEGISGTFGDYDLDIGPTTLTIRPGATERYVVFSSGFATLTDGATVTEVTGVVVWSDGEVNIGSACLGNDAGLVGDTLGVAGVLPFDVTNACVIAEDGDVTRLIVDGTFDTDLLDGAFGEGTEVTLQVGGATSSGNTFTIEFINDADGLRPVDLGPITLGVTGLAAGPFSGSLELTFGGYSDGVLSGWYVEGTVPPTPSVLAGGSFQLDLDLGTDPVDGGQGGTDIAVGVGAVIRSYAVADSETTTLVVGGRLEGSGRVLVGGSGVEVVGLGADFGMNITLDLSQSPATLTVGDATFGDSASADRLFVGVGPATIEFEDVDLFPAPGVIVDVGTAEFGFAAGEGLDGWSGSMSDFDLRYSRELGVQVCAGPAFTTSISASSEPNLFSWLPITITDATLDIPDIVPDPAATCDPVIDRIGDIANATITASLTLSIGVPGADASESVVTASVDGVTIEVAKLIDYAEWFADGAQGTPPAFPITGLQGLSFGMAPTDFGPLTIGGQIGIGYVLDEFGRPVWYGRVGAAVQWNNIGLALDVGLSQYGPMWATISTPLTIPLGPTGFTISGVGGGLLFEHALPTVRATDCPVPQTPDSEPLGEAPCVDALALVRNADFELVAPQAQDDILAAVRAKAAEVGGAPPTDLGALAVALLPTDVTLYLQGSINHATGAVDGTVKLGANIDLTGDQLPDGALIGKGELSFFGFEAGELGLIVDYTDPIDPTFAMALGVPGEGTLASFIPAQATFGGTFETTGFYAAQILVVRELVLIMLEASATLPLPGGDAVLDTMAATIDANRARPLAQLILDADGDGTVSDTEHAAVPVITRAVMLDWLADRMGPTVTDFEQQVIDDALTLARISEAVVAELFEAAVNGVPTPPSQPPAAPIADPDEVLAAYLAFVRSTLLSGDVGNRLIDLILDTVDPKLEILGEAGIEIFGLPIGPQQQTRIYADKHQLGVEFNGSVSAMINAATAVLVQDDTQFAFEAPWELQAIIEATLAGEPPAPDAFALDPFRGKWAAGASSQGLALSMPFSASGFIVPAGQSKYVTGRIDNPDRPLQVELSPQVRTDLLADGGLLIDGSLSMLDLIADPEAVWGALTAEQLDCFSQDFEDVLGRVQDLPVCFELFTGATQIGAAQIYVPNPGTPWPAEGLTTLADGFYGRGHVNEFSVFGFPLLTVPNGDRIGFVLDESGLTVDGSAAPLIRPIGDGQYVLDLRLSFLTGGQAIPIVLDTVETDLGPFLVPRAGGSLTIDGNDVAGIMDSLGLGGTGMASGDAEVTVEAYTPGYDPDAAPGSVQLEGGVQVTATGEVDGAFNGLISAPGTSVTGQIRATHSGGPTPNLAAVLTTDGPIRISGATMAAGAIIRADYVDGQLTVTFEGNVELPNELGTVSASGSIDVGAQSASLTLGTNSLTLGSVQLAGQFTLQLSSGSWTISVAGSGRDSASATVAGWGTYNLTSATIQSDGSLQIDDLDLGDLGSSTDRVWVQSATLSLSVGAGTPPSVTGELGGIVHVAITSDTTLEYDLAALSAGSPLAGFDIAGSDGGAFSHTFSTDDLQIDGLDLVRGSASASVTIGRTAGSETRPGTLYASFDAAGSIDDLGLEGSVTVAELRIDSTGTVSGSGTVAITSPVTTTATVTVHSVMVGTQRVIEFRLGDSWLRTDGTWHLDLDSLPTVGLGGGGTASPVRLVGGSLERVLGDTGLVTRFSGEVEIVPLAQTMSLTGTYDPATQTLVTNVATRQLDLGALRLSGGARLTASPTTWTLEIAPGSSTATASLDGWGSVTTSGTTIGSDGSFSIALDFDDFGTSSALLRVDEPSLVVTHVPGQELSATLGGMVRLRASLPGSTSTPCWILGNEERFTEPSHCVNLDKVFDIALPVGGNGEFSETFTTDVALGDWDLGTATFRIERYGDGTVSIGVSATASVAFDLADHVGLVPVGLVATTGTIAVTNLTSSITPDGTVSISGQVRATLDLAFPGFAWAANTQMTVSTPYVDGRRVLQLSVGDSFLRSNGDWKIDLDGSLFGSSGQDRVVVATFPIGGTTDYNLFVRTVAGTLLNCTVDGEAVAPVDAGAQTKRFALTLTEGLHPVSCTVTDLVAPIAPEESMTFDILVIRERPAIVFDQPADLWVPYNPEGNTELTRVWFDGALATTNASATTCSPTSGGLLPMGPTSVTCTATNADYGSTPVSRSFQVTVFLQALALVVDTGGSATSDSYVLVQQLTTSGTTSSLETNRDGDPVASRDDELLLTGSDSLAGSTVRVGMYSTRYALGSTTVRPDGTWRMVVTIPDDIELGMHTLEVITLDADGRRRADFARIEIVPATTLMPLPSRPTVPAPAPEPGSRGVDPPPGLAQAETAGGNPRNALGAGEGSGSDLAHSGATTGIPILLGVTLLAFGVTLVGLGHRRRSNHFRRR